MVVIIAEKPSLARNIAASIGTPKKQNGYIEVKDYFVTWGFGHLFSLCDIEDYTGPTTSGRWSLENLPCFPENFKFKLRHNPDGTLDEGVKRQFDIISSLINRDDVDTIVNAGDADREGEIIIRLIIENGLRDKRKAQKRLWLPDQTPETVRKALEEMKDEESYNSLANEGYARTYVDWLYGVNLTRYATLKTGMLLRVGRVIVPIVKAIYDRDMAIRNFKPEVYYTPLSVAEQNGEKIELQSRKKYDKNRKKDCESLCEKYNLATAVVTDKKTKKDVLKPSKLFSLSKLQNVLGKKYKMPMDKSLAIVQKLYEEGYVTYPRTNSEYLATAEKDKIKKIISGISALGYPIKFKDNKNIFDDKKIESHSALTPTYKIPKKEHLSEDEMIVYTAILRRFVAVFCAEDCVAQKTEIKIKVGEYEEFTLKGTVILSKGWTKYDDYTKQDKILPNLEVGDTVNHNFTPKEKETTPPKHYTIETLNNYLKNPFKEDKAALEKEDAVIPDEYDDAEEYRAVFEGLELGTEATRTGIIDNARKSKYIELKKDVYHILKDGEYLIEQLMQMNISMDKYKTSTLGKALKQVFRDEITVENCVSIAKNSINEVFSKTETNLETDTDTGFYGDNVGVCPLCKGEVKKGRYGYGCANWREGCKFRINGSILGRVISIANARKLLSEGKTAKIKGFTSKNGKLFDAALKLENGQINFDF